MTRPGVATGLEVVPVEDRAALERFIRLPEQLFRDDPNYVPPLRTERRAALTRRGNPLLRRSEAAFWIARRDGRDVGRISAQRDPLAARGEDPPGQFGLLAAANDPAVFAALLATAEAWLARHGSRRVQGPFSLGINEEAGLLVDGFDTPPMLMMPHDPPYAGPRLEELGYRKAPDLLAFLCDTGAGLPAAAARIVARGLPPGAVLRPLRLRELTADIAALVDIFNDAWADNWGFVPITEDEVSHLARSLRPLLHERLIWFAEVEGAPVAFGVCLPDLNAAVRDMAGRLLPFNWLRLLWRLKVTGVQTARIALMGVRRSLAGTVLGRLLALHLTDTLRREALARGMRAVELSWILEGNRPMRHLAEAVGGRRYKTFRIYERVLSA